jgi:hypothetical protein
MEQLKGYDRVLYSWYGKYRYDNSRKKRYQIEYAAYGLNDLQSNGNPYSNI